MRSWWSLTMAMWRAFVKDRSALFFYFLFPLMFLLLFGLLLGNEDLGRTSVAVVGEGPIIEALPEQVLTVEPYGTVEEAVRAVQDGDVPAAVIEDGTTVTVRYSESSQVSSATVRGVVDAVVNEANLEAAGAARTFEVQSSQVEDESFEPIQYLTAGLLAWAVAMSAAFGAAMNLVTWRRSQLLRRLRLAPISAGSVVGARVGVSMTVALLQGAVFIGVALSPPFGLQLRGPWFAAIPLLLAGTLAFMAIGCRVRQRSRG